MDPRQTPRSAEDPLVGRGTPMVKEARPSSAGFRGPVPQTPLSARYSAGNGPAGGPVRPIGQQPRTPQRFEGRLPLVGSPGAGPFLVRAGGPPPPGAPRPPVSPLQGNPNRPPRSPYPNPPTPRGVPLYPGIRGPPSFPLAGPPPAANFVPNQPQRMQQPLQRNGDLGPRIPDGNSGPPSPAPRSASHREPEMSSGQPTPRATPETVVTPPPTADDGTVKDRKGAISAAGIRREPETMEEGRVENRSPSHPGNLPEPKNEAPLAKNPPSAKVNDRVAGSENVNNVEDDDDDDDDVVVDKDGEDRSQSPGATRTTPAEDRKEIDFKKEVEEEDRDSPQDSLPPSSPAITPAELQQRPGSDTRRSESSPAPRSIDSSAVPSRAESRQGESGRSADRTPNEARSTSVSPLPPTPTSAGRRATGDSPTTNLSVPTRAPSSGRSSTSPTPSPDHGAGGGPTTENKQPPESPSPVSPSRPIEPAESPAVKENLNLADETSKVEKVEKVDRGNKSARTTPSPVPGNRARTPGTPDVERGTLSVGRSPSGRSLKSEAGGSESGAERTNRVTTPTTNGVTLSPTKRQPPKSRETNSSNGSPVKSPSKSVKSLPRTPDTATAAAPPSTAEKKKPLRITPVPSVSSPEVPMNKIQVGAAPSPNLKTVRSKIGSLENASYKPGGGKVKIENRKLDFSKAQPKIAAKNDKYTPSGGEKKQIPQVKLQWNAKPKVGSLDNATYKPGGGDKKIETVKLDFKDKAKPKVGSRDNAKHVPGGGTVKIETQKIDIRAESKVGSLDNVGHKPGGGDKKIFDDREYARRTGSNLESQGGSGAQIQSRSAAVAQRPNFIEIDSRTPEPPPTTPTRSGRRAAKIAITPPTADSATIPEEPDEKDESSTAKVESFHLPRLARSPEIGLNRDANASAKRDFGTKLPKLTEPESSRR